MSAITPIRPSALKSKALRLVILCGMLFAIAVACRAWFSPKLPTIQLKDGRELRVLKVSYGTGKHWEHYLGNAPNWTARFWAALPGPLQDRFDKGKDRTVWIWMVILKPDEKFDQEAVDAAMRKGPIEARQTGQRVKNIMRWSGHVVESRGQWKSDLRYVIPRVVPKDSRELNIPMLIDKEEIDLVVPNPAYGRP